MDLKYRFDYLFMLELFECLGIRLAVSIASRI